jgi:hypothetical protein
LLLGQGCYIGNETKNRTKVKITTDTTEDGTVENWEASSQLQGRKMG